MSAGVLVSHDGGATWIARGRGRGGGGGGRGRRRERGRKRGEVPGQSAEL